MKKFASLALVSLSLFAFGCKGDEERMIELEEEKAQGYEKAGDDCDKIAKSLEEFNAKHGAEHKELKKKLDAKYTNKADAEKAMEKYKDRLEKNKKIIIGAVFKCHDNEAYSKAMKSN